MSVIGPRPQLVRDMCNWNNIYISTYGKERFIY